MESLVIAGDFKRPAVNLNTETGQFLFEGRSIPEDSAKFYAPILRWLKQYYQNPLPETVFTLRMEYFNSSSLACMLELLVESQRANDSGASKVSVHWYYEEDDDDLRVSGEDLMNLLDLPFEMHPVPEE